MQPVILSIWLLPKATETDTGRNMNEESRFTTQSATHRPAS
jgi:hypothetical protein